MLLLMQLLLLMLALLLPTVHRVSGANGPPSMQLCTSLSSKYVTLSSTDCSTAPAVAEEVPIGTHLMRFTATDPEGDQVTMSLTGSAQAVLYFGLESFPGNSTAVLKVISRLDAETFPGVYMKFTIEMNDGNSNRLTKTYDVVVINDINDNEPEFENMPYRWEIPENAVSPSINFTVDVVDKDRGSSGMTIDFKEVSGSDISSIFSFSSVSVGLRCSGCSGRRYSRTISLLRPLDYETRRFYQISVNATDTAAGGASSLTDIIINVVDSQDTPPFFEGIPYVRSVRENAAAGTPLLTVVAKDGDRGNPNEVRYQLDAGGSFAKYFSVNASSGLLTVGSLTLDRESSDILAAFGTVDLTVTAKEVSATPQAANVSEASTTVRIVVLDDNDFRPQFGQSSYNATVTENTQPGVPLNLQQRIFVRDLDAGSNGQFNISVVKDGAAYADFEASPVEVDREAGVSLIVANASLLDYETVTAVTFQLVATETRTTQKFSTNATINLQILDANDNRPVFNQTKYTFSIPENAPVNTFVGQVWATDRDSAVYGTVAYSLEGTDAWKFFVNSTSGQIFVRVEADKNETLLDREKFPTIYLTAQAADGGGYVSAVQVEVQLSDMNDQVPKFARSSYAAVLRENSANFETPVQVEATDADEAGSSNSLLTYSIESGDPGGSFGIDGRSGLLRVQKTVDFESLASHRLNLTVVAADSGTPSLNSSVLLTVTVLDQNDNSPACTAAVFEATVPENATSGASVARINATDADAAGSDNSRLFFRIRSGAADKFAIDGSSGVVSVERGANLDVGRFGSSYNLTVFVYDRGSPQLNGNCSLLIRVQDVNNQKPYFASASRRESVPENLPVGSALPFSYAATDPDSSAKLSYSILVSQMRATRADGQPVSAAAYNFTSLFRVDPNNGTVFVSNSLDREQAEEILLPIFVRDLAAETPLPVQTATGTLIITLADVNDELPVFLPPAVNGTYRVTVSESVKPPSDISLKVTAADSDKTSLALTYRVQPPSSHFDIDSSTGQVSVKAALDRETQPQLVFTVTANDSVHVATATVSVTVADANDMEPRFYRFANVTVAENATVGSVLTTVAANDSDSGDFGRVNYRIVSGARGFFGVNATSGELRLLRQLDRDVAGGDAFSIVVEAFDNPDAGDSKRTSKILSVTVTDVNDCVPTFTESNFTITSLLESMEAGQLIKEITATDCDAGANREVTYSLAAVAGQSDKALRLFSVATRRRGDAFVAEISTKASLKYSVGWYAASLLATDAGSPALTGTAVVSFFVADTNDFSPEFVHPNASSTVFRVNESANGTTTVGRRLLRAVAVDRDFGNNSVVRFSLGSSNGDHEAFGIDAVTGELTIRASFDRETKSEYRFQIVARDLGTPQLSTPTNIVVEVVDVDESPPVFDVAGRQQRLNVAENRAPTAAVPGLTGINGVRIGVIASAKDPDATGATAAVCYFVINKMYDKFYLNKTTGELYSLSSFDREAASQHTLYILAVSESQCSSTSYEWSGAPKPSTRRRRSLDTNPISYDPSNPAMTRLVVSVSDANDNPPKWSQSTFFGGVTVEDPPNTEVFRFANSVTDADVGNNSRLTFSMTQPRADTAQLKMRLEQLGIYSILLQLQPSTGVLRTGSRTYFQSDMAGSFAFNVSASDGTYTATASCTIYLLSLHQQIVITIAEKTENVTKMRDTLANYLSNITGWRVVVDNIVTHKRADGTADSSKTDVYAHAIQESDSTIVPAVTLRDKIDLLWASIRVLYKDFGVLSVRLAVESAEQDSILEALKISLIVVACGLTILLFVACLSLWSCRRMYRRKLKAATAVAFGPNGQTADTMRMPGTNLHTFEGSNPVWMETNYDGMNRENRAFESDKDSIDDNEIRVGDQSKGVYQFDEVEKSLNFYDNEDNEGQEFSKDSSEMLRSAVAAGPGIVRRTDEEILHSNGGTTLPLNLQSMPTADI